MYVSTSNRAVRMKLKRNNSAPPPSIFTPEEHRRVVAVFSILIAIDKRLTGNAKESRNRKNESKRQVNQ